MTTEARKLLWSTDGLRVYVGDLVEPKRIKVRDSLRSRGFKTVGVAVANSARIFIAVLFESEDGERSYRQSFNGEDLHPVAVQRVAGRAPDPQPAPQRKRLLILD